MNCQEALSLLYDIIDDEASEIDHAQVEEHLKSCCNCSGIFKVEESWQRYLSERLEEDGAVESEALGRLRGRVREELSRQDASGAPGAGTRITGTIYRTVAAAAVVVLVIAATYVGAGYYEHYRDFHHLELAHQQSVDHPDQFADPENTRSAVAFAEDSTSLSVLASSGDLKMVGGIVTEINHVQVSHFVYRDASVTVSLFVCREADMAVPDGTIADQRGHQTHECPGCNLCYGACGKARLVAAESTGQVDLGQFLEGHQETLATAF